MTAWHGGKGSGSRPRQVSNEDYANRWDAIFQREKVKVSLPHARLCLCSVTLIKVRT